MLIKVDDVNIWEQHNLKIIDKREVHRVAGCSNRGAMKAEDTLGCKRRQLLQVLLHFDCSPKPVRGCMKNTVTLIRSLTTICISIVDGSFLMIRVGKLVPKLLAGMYFYICNTTCLIKELKTLSKLLPRYIKNHTENEIKMGCQAKGDTKDRNRPNRFCIYL